MPGLAVQAVLAQSVVELFRLLAGDLVHPVVVVAELGEVALGFKVGDKAGLRVPDALDLGVLHRGEGVGHAAHAGDAEGHQPPHGAVVKGHLALFVGVLVVHIVDDVHGVDVSLCQPGPVEVDALDELVVVQVLLGPHGHFGAHLVALQLVPAAVDGQQHQLGQVGPGAEELHVLAHAHGGNAAGNGVVVAVDRAHHVVVLILEGVGVAGDLGGKALPVLRQVGAPQHGEVGLRRGPQVVQGVEHAEAGLGHQGPAVLAHAAHAFGDPHGVAAEQLVVFGGAQVPGHAQL